MLITVFGYGIAESETDDMIHVSWRAKSAPDVKELRELATLVQAEPRGFISRVTRFFEEKH